MNELRYVISREGRGYIIWDRAEKSPHSVVVISRKSLAQAEADALNAKYAKEATP